MVRRLHPRRPGDADPWHAIAGGINSVKNIQRFALAVSFAVALSVLGVGQVSFNEVKATNANGNSATGLNNSSQALANAGTNTSSDVAIWSRTDGFKSIGMSSKNSTAAGINNTGAVAGSSNVSGLSQAFLWAPNRGADWLGSLGSGMSVATGLNDSNAVVGLSYNAAYQQHAFLWTAGSGMQDLTPDLTSIGGATATGINASNEVVGYYFPNGSRWPIGFTWTESAGLQAFGPFGTIALAVNNTGTAVGQFTNGAGYKHAFLWTQSGGITDLGTLGGPSSIAYSVNKNGWVVGTSLTADGTGILHPFLWTPAGGMQDLRTLAGLSKSLQPYSIQVNDYGVVAMSTNRGLELLSPMMYATMTSSQNPSLVGQSVTFTVKLSSIAGPPPDGEVVKFTVNGVYYGSATLSGGVAQFTTSAIPSGPHTVVAKYVGDANYLPNKYSAIQQQVN
jgi:probable HAF family extracellular repeat protein